MTWWTRLARNRLLDVGAAALALIGVGRVMSRLPVSAVSNDFAHYYLASDALLHGENPYTLDLGTRYPEHGFQLVADLPHVIAANPPPFLWLFAPLAALPVRGAFLAWVTVQVTCLVLILWLTCRLLGEPIGGRGQFFVVTMTLASAPVYWHFVYSQLGLLLAALLLAGYALLRGGRTLLACLLVAAAGLLKLLPFVLLPWFVWRSATNWRGRLVQLAMVGAFIGAVVLATQPRLWVSFGQEALPLVTMQSLNHSFNYTVPSMLINLFLAGCGFAPGSSDARTWQVLGAATGLALIAGAYLVSLRCGGDLKREFCLLTAVMLAGSIRAWGHYFVLMIFPVVVAASRVRARFSVGRLVWVGLAILLLNFMATVESPWLNKHLVWKVTLNELPLYGLLLLGWFFWKELEERA
jgi:hypothetical protein